MSDAPPDLASMGNNPQAAYRLIREIEPDPADEISMMMAGMPARDEAVRSVLRDPAVFSSMYDAVQIGQVRPLIPLQIDPPDHTKYRKLLDPLFAPKKVALLEPATRALVTELIDDVIDDGGCNFHAVIAEPLPSTVFLQLLGMPLERRDEFIELKDGIIRPEADSDEARAEAMNATGQQIYRVLQEVIDARRAAPKDDLISGFLTAEVDGHRLTDEDILDIGYLFFLAGLDTVTASLDCMLAFLSQNPVHRRRLVQEPAIIPQAMEEMLRWETPVPGVPRITAVDTEINGCPVAAGQTIGVMLGSANTDERAWDRADLVDFDRELNKHLAFGGGVHRCLGSHLARMEMRVALEEWHRRVPDYQLVDGTELEYSEGLRQVNFLPLEW